MKSLILALAFCAAAQAAPVLFYLDHISGPNTGGRANNGAAVCVAGKGFGISQGSSTVTVGGGAVASYLRWTDGEVCFQLGAAAVTGNVIVTVGGNASNALPFTVRSAPIYFAGATTDIGGSPGTASDSNPGTFDLPKATIRACKNLLTSGSGAFCYARGTLSQTGIENVNAAITLNTSGTLSAPLTLAGWPGDADKPIVGDYLPASYNVHSALYWYTSGNYWSISRLWLRAGGAAVRAMPAIDHLRLTNSKAECPAGDGGVGCVGSAWTIINPSQSMSFKVFGNELTNIGCGEGVTSGPDNSAGLPLQPLQYPCQPLGVQAGTVSMSGGSTLTITGATFPWNTAIYAGTHILVDTDGDGTYEDSVLSSASASALTLYSNSFVTTTFSGAPWKYRPFTSSKLYHVTYWGGDNNGTEMGWNWLHNNSAQHGIDFHATAQTGSGAAYQVISTIAAGTPARMTLVSPFTGISGQQGLYNGQRLDVVGNSTLPTAAYYVSLPTPGDYGTVDLYNDVALTSPVTLASSGTGGNASRTAFGPFNLDIHDNIVNFQNGACLALAQADPDHGPIKIYNNVFANCGTGPVTSVGGFAMPGFYGLNTADVPTRNLNGSGTVEWYNNTMYAASTYPTPPSGSTVGALWMNPTTTLTLRVRNSPFYQPSGLPFSGGTAVARITGFNNLWYGSNSASIPANVVSSLTSDPLFNNPVAGDFTLQATSPAIDTGATTEATRDILGVSRPQGAAFDLGAYEYVSGSTPVDPLTITTTTLPDGVVGGSYSQAFAATGGTGTKTWDATVNDAAGLSMSTAGIYGGVPLLAGTFDLTARVTDDSGSTTRAYTITIADAPVDPNAVTVTATPAAASAIVRYGAAALVGNQTCVVSLKQGSTTIQSLTDTGGRPSRVAGFTGLAAGTYTPSVACAPFGSGTGSGVVVTASTGLTAAVPVTGYSRSEIGAAKMLVEWGYTAALTGTPVTISCVGACAASIPGVATGAVVWVRLSYLTSGDVVVAQGEAFPVVVR